MIVDGHIIWLIYKMKVIRGQILTIMDQNSFFGLLDQSFTNNVHFQSFGAQFISYWPYTLYCTW